MLQMLHCNVKMHQATQWVSRQCRNRIPVISEGPCETDQVCIKGMWGKRNQVCFLGNGGYSGFQGSTGARALACKTMNGNLHTRSQMLWTIRISKKDGMVDYWNCPAIVDLNTEVCGKLTTPLQIMEWSLTFLNISMLCDSSDSILIPE